MKNKIILITGSTGGIGFQTALGFAKLGGTIILTGRNKTSSEASVMEIKQQSGNQNVDFLLGDLSTQAGIRSLAAQFKQKYNHLDVLINNVGHTQPTRSMTPDGVESVFAVNVVSPVLLTTLLMESLKAAISARVITLTGGDTPNVLDINNLQSEKSYDGLITYSNSKVAMMAVMREYAERTKGSTVTMNVCYPGQASTNMTRSVTPEMFSGAMRLIYPLFKLITRPDGGKSAAKAARSSIYLASSPDLEGVSGKYFDKNCKEKDWPLPAQDVSIRAKVWAEVQKVIRP